MGYGLQTLNLNPNVVARSNFYQRGHDESDWDSTSVVIIGLIWFKVRVQASGFRGLGFRTV